MTPTLKLTPGVPAIIGIPAYSKASSFTKPVPVTLLGSEEYEDPAVPTPKRKLFRPASGPSGPPGDDDEGDGDDEADDDEDWNGHDENWDGEWEVEGGDDEPEGDDGDDEDDEEEDDEEEETPAPGTANEESILLRREMKEMVKVMKEQNKAKTKKSTPRHKEADAFNAPALPLMKYYKQYRIQTRMKVVAGLSHEPEAAALWWDEIDRLREKFGDDTDARRCPFPASTLPGTLRSALLSSLHSKRVRTSKKSSPQRTKECVILVASSNAARFSCASSRCMTLTRMERPLEISRT